MSQYHRVQKSQPMRDAGPVLPDDRQLRGGRFYMGAALRSHQS
jgi:hypothetical protein